MLSWLRTHFTLARWLSQSFMMCGVGLLMQASVWQLVLGNTQLVMTYGELTTTSARYLSVANLIGTAIVFYALHLRDWEQSLWVEVSGYAAMLWSLLLWVLLVYLVVPLPNTSYGLNLTEGFVIASSIRAGLILSYKRAARRADLDRTIKLRQILGY